VSEYQRTHYFRYLWTVTRHKWFVFVECCRVGMPLRGLLHDMSKFRPSEFFAYARYFNGDRSREGTQDAFDMAWLLHQKRNRHHWQWWMLPLDDGGTQLIPMDAASRAEMLCDWRGAGRTYGSVTSEWYAANKPRIRLAYETRAWIEGQLEEATHAPTD
jgi:hypothetical protein